MNIHIKFLSKQENKPAKLILVEFSNDNKSVEFIMTDDNGNVSENDINALEDLVKDLKEQNELNNNNDKQRIKKDSSKA
jgi:hypothetical protein